MTNRDPYDTDDELTAAEAARLRKEEAQRQEAADIVWLMSSKTGRRLMRRLAAEGGIYRTTFRPNSEMPYLEGRRSLALQFYAEAAALTPKNYLLMLTEQMEGEAQEDTQEHERSSE